MTDILTLAENMAKTTAMIDVLVRDAIVENEGDIRERNQEQLKQGKDISNRKIKPKYKSKAYAKRKNKLNSSPGLGTPDLRGETGNLYDEIGVVVEGMDVIVTSFDEKMKFKSIQQYLPNVFGLNHKNQEANKKLNNITLVENYKKLAGL